MRVRVPMPMRVCVPMPMRLRVLCSVLLIVAYTSITSTTLQAQRTDRNGYAFGRRDNVDAPASANSSGDRRDTRIAPTISVSASPRTVHLVSVAVPDELRVADSVLFRVVHMAGATVAGPDSGRVHGTDGRVMLSVSVPSQAMAGRLRMAEVGFRTAADSASIIIVPVDVLVLPVHALSVRAAAPMIHAVQGRRTAAQIVLANAGNVHDTLRLSVLLPGQWRADINDAPHLVIAPGTTVTRDIELTAPRQHVPGSAIVSVRAMRSRDDSASADAEQRVLHLPVEVLPATRTDIFAPVLGVSYNALQQPGVQTMDSWGLTLSGPLAAGVSLHAVWTQRAVFGAPGLARVGGGQLFPSAAFTHPRWSFEAGNASADFGDMAGLLRNGRGVSGTVGDSVWRLTAMAARPFTLDVGPIGTDAAGSRTRYAGALAGVAVHTVQRGVAWSTTVSHLRDPLLMRAQLDAIAVGAARALDAGRTARGEIAWRRWQDGAGVGAAAEFGQRSAQSDWRLHATHAPGGSRAFARAQTDVTLTGAQALGALRLGYVGYYAADQGTDGAQLATRGVAIMPQWRIGRDGNVGLEARAGDATSGDVRATLATQSTAFGAFGSSRIAQVTATSSATYTRLARDLAFSDTETTRLQETQLVWTTQVLLPLPSGTLDAYSSLQRRLGADALSDGQYDMMVRAEQLAVPFVNGRVQASAAIGRMVSLSTGTGVMIKRMGLSAMLPLDTDLRLDVESNPWLRQAGRSGWSTALRVERSFGTPGFLRAGRGTGVVFEDLNGNNARDAGERGLSGVVVRVGSEVVVTDRGGVYRLTRTGGGLADIDERSLPFGLMVAPSMSRAMMAGSRDGTLDIAVLPVGSLEVQLAMVADTIVRHGSGAFAGVTVAAVDAAGRRHIARVMPDGRALFEALPPGAYRLDVDGSAAREPLSVQGGAATFRLDGQRDRQTVRVLLGPRSVRILRAPSATRSLSAAGR